MKKNILVVDDSALMRRVISDIIDSDKELQVVDFAFDGLIALEMIQKKKYDCLVLDIQMPKMGGVEFLRTVNALGIRVTVVVVSSVAAESGKETMECLEYGAFDFVRKPNGLADMKGGLFRDSLLQVVHLAIETGKTTSVISRKEPIQNKVRRSISVSKTKTYNKTKKLIAIACSTGGPRALQEVIPLLPKNIDAPILLVQHMPEGFTNSLAERLNDMSEVRVKEASDGDVIAKGTVYIAKGGYQLKVSDRMNGDVINIVKEPARAGLRPCADIMFETLRFSNYDHIICVVLTGMGGDGTKGIMQLKDSKDIFVIAQDRDSSTVYGMPKTIYEAGITDEVVTLGEVASAITNITGVC